MQGCTRKMKVDTHKVWVSTFLDKCSQITAVPLLTYSVLETNIKLQRQRLPFFSVPVLP